MNPIKSLSYSKWALVNQCPAKFKYTYIDKQPEEPSIHLERGTKVHKEVEDFIKFPGMPLPESAIVFEEYLHRIKTTLKPQSEQFWCADKEFKPTLSFNDPRTCVIAKVDIFYLDGKTLYIDDIKTGKAGDVNREQLDLYACVGFQRFPNVEKIDCKLLYVDNGVYKVRSYLAKNKDMLLVQWKARLKFFLELDKFEPTPTALCKWCSFRKSKLGPCIYD